MNLGKINAGLSTQADPPAIETVVKTGLVSIETFDDAPTGLMQVRFDSPLNSQFVLFASPPQSPGRNFNGDYRFIIAVQISGTDTSPFEVDFQPTLTAKFGNFVAGQRYFFRFRWLDLTDGTPGVGADLVGDIATT